MNFDDMNTYYCEHCGMHIIFKNMMETIDHITKHDDGYDTNPDTDYISVDHDDNSDEESGLGL